MNQKKTIFRILSKHLHHKVFIEPVYKRTALAGIRLACRNCLDDVIVFDNPDAVIPPVGPWEKDLFFYYNSPEITSYHDPYEGWRGFRTPAFERDTFLAWFVLAFPNQRAYYEPDQDAIFCPREGHDPDFQWIKGFDVQTVEGNKHLYAPVNWFWETVTKEGHCESCGFPFSAHNAHSNYSEGPCISQEITIFQVLSEHYHHKVLIESIEKRTALISIRLSCQHCSEDVVVFDNPYPVIPPFEPWEKNIFAIDDSRGIIGYYDLYENWAGWRTPAFQRDELLTWLELEPEYHGVQYDPEQDAIYCHRMGYDFNSQWAKGFDVSTVDGLKHLYGPGEWYWEIISETEALSRDFEHKRKAQLNDQQGPCSDYEWNDDDIPF